MNHVSPYCRGSGTRRLEVALDDLVVFYNLNLLDRKGKLYPILSGLQSADLDSMVSTFTKELVNIGQADLDAEGLTPFTDEDLAKLRGTAAAMRKSPPKTYKKKGFFKTFFGLN